MSTGARDVMRLPRAGVEVGAKAELLAVRAVNLSDAIANASADRYVIHAGRLVAASSVSRSIAPILGLAERSPEPSPEPQYETR